MSPDIVRGSDCLQYIDKPLGFANIKGYRENSLILDDEVYDLHLAWDNSSQGVFGNPTFTTMLHKAPHNVSKRKIGLVTNNYSDGGLRVIILGDNEELVWTSQNGFESVYTEYLLIGHALYDVELSSLIKRDDYIDYPAFRTEVGAPPLYYNGCYCFITDEYSNGTPQYFYTFDESMDFMPTFHRTNIPPTKQFSYQGNNIDNINRFIITKDKTNTLIYGEDSFVPSGKLLYLYGAGSSQNPLELLTGNIYQYFYLHSLAIGSLSPKFFIDRETAEQYNVHFGSVFPSFNGICIPYNLILTNNEQFALEYLESGTLPPDAYLYPLDWNNLPRYEGEPIPEPDEPTDNPDDNTPNDNSRDITPNPPVVPATTPAQLSNYNFYWLTLSEYESFVQWFWHDIGAYNDFDDIINKIKGLYNDVASAVLMCRFYPVEYEWITGIDILQAPTDVIKLGMLQKQGAVQIIDKTHPAPVRKIGSVAIPKKYKSFVDLAPYSQLSLYLPFHGFVDLDIDIFMGHTLDVYAIYDYLTGTMQYLIYCDDTMLVNSFVVKFAVDIPLTLQTKNDRDSSAFQNVSSVVGGLIGAGVGMSTGNPIGMTLGITQGMQAMNSANASAPLNVRGTVGETGALYSPPQCAIILRQPTIAGSDNTDDPKNNLNTWKANNGILCGYGYKLSSLKNCGLTIVSNPRISFTSSTPLQSEVDEIYSYLEKGVIL